MEATQLKSGDYFGEMSFMATCRRFLKDDDQHMTDTGSPREKLRKRETERARERERERARKRERERERASERESVRESARKRAGESGRERERACETAKEIER